MPTLLVTCTIIILYSLHAVSCGAFIEEMFPVGTYQPPLIIKPTLEASTSKHDLEGMDGKSTNTANNFNLSSLLKFINQVCLLAYFCIH